MHPLEEYLDELLAIRSSGAAVNELAYYTPLAELLNEVGKKLKPRVRCIQQLRNTGAGMPDFGLFTSDQFEKAIDLKPLSGQLPSRGAGEIKSPSEDISQTIQTKQISDYVAHYGMVLVTNYREFSLVGNDAYGKIKNFETYRLAPNEAEFWSLVRHPRKGVDPHGVRFLEYLQRVLIHNAPLSDPKDVAWVLASYAREARVIIEHAGPLPVLDDLRQALEHSLGIEFRNQKGEHFFRSTLVQTLFYGIFSAWVLWHTEQPNRTDSFDWRLSPYYLRVPVLQALFQEIAQPVKLKRLGLMEVLDWTGTALNRVVRKTFFPGLIKARRSNIFMNHFWKPTTRNSEKSWGCGTPHPKLSSIWYPG
jgi:hypothetical protein